MSTPNGDLPAYPVVSSGGLSKIEAFTMAAMQGLCTGIQVWELNENKERFKTRLAAAAFGIAQETLRVIELDKSTPSLRKDRNEN